jgi:tRNA(Ile)-lysidine synthase
MADGPIADGELAGLFADLRSFGSLALAVSGGPDSTALMHLYARWRSMESAPRAVVLTVDHGLRGGSAAEAQAVSAAAKRLGFASQILRWTGPKPETGLQEAAREVRYRLMARAAAAQGLEAIVTAHTEDDQAETLLMRLARGSGLDGLAAMPARSEQAGVPVVRPLLAVPKGRLIATLKTASIPFATDPSNSDPRFERSRLRSGMTALVDVGLTSPMLARSARRLERARRALEAATDELARSAVEVTPAGALLLALEALAEAPEELAVRLAQRLTIAAGGAAPAPSLAKVEALTEWLASAPTGGRTLGRAEVSIRSAGGVRRALFVRETGRAPLPDAALAPGEAVIFDGRFRVRLAARRPAVDIRAGARLADGVRDALGDLLKQPGAAGAPFALQSGACVGSPFDAAAAAKIGLSFAFVGLVTVFGTGRRSETQK